MRFVLESVKICPKDYTYEFVIIDNYYNIKHKMGFGQLYFEDLCYGMFSSKELRNTYPQLDDDYINYLERKYKNVGSD